MAVVIEALVGEGIGGPVPPLRVVVAPPPLMAVFSVTVLGMTVLAVFGSAETKDAALFESEPAILVAQLHTGKRKPTASYPFLTANDHGKRGGRGSLPEEAPSMTA